MFPEHKCLHALLVSLFFTLQLMMNQTLTGLFPTRREADLAIDELRMRGLTANDVSVMAQDTVVNGVETKTTGDNIVEKAGAGTATGATVGGLLGLLVGIGALAIPGVGALFIAGPIAAALGLTGVAATTVSGALSGALAGGLLGALIGLGFTKEDAELYERRIKAGDVLVAATVHETGVTETAVREVFNMHGAQEVRLLRDGVKA